MSSYEFKVVPAPIRPRKLTGLARGQDRFCATLTDVMTDLGLEGWEFVRAETLPFENRRLWFWRTRAPRSCLVFRRAIPALADTDADQAIRPRRVAPDDAVSVIATRPARLTLSEPVMPSRRPARRLHLGGGVQAA